jgi:hypothetical protein
MPPLPAAPAGKGNSPPQQSKYIVFDDFSGGMNTQSARQGLNQKAASWIENLLPIAPNFLLGVGAPLAALANLTGETNVRIFQATINQTVYLIVFCLSGAAYAISVPGGGVTRFAPSATFSATGGDVTTFGGTRILIADSQAGYCTWDGTVFVMQGGVSPNIQITNAGTGFQGATVSITGGSGTGATANATVINGSLVAIILTSAGVNYQASDTLTVTISGTGGSGAQANAHVWPYLTPKPNTLAFAFGRVWLGAGRTLIVTGTGSSTFGLAYDDFDPGDASVTTTISDADLQQQITVLRYLEDYLNIIGDNSVKQIGGISVSNGTTNFTITTLSSDQGTVFPLTVVSYNRLLLFANTVGVYAVYGASVEKISNAMDGLFRSVNFAALPPSAAVNDINNIHTYLLLVQYLDPALGARSLILAYQNRKWSVISQGNGLTVIATAIVNGITETFGTSGNDVTQLLQSMTVALPYKLQTAMVTAGEPIFDKTVTAAGIAVDSATISDLAMTIDTENGSESVPLVSTTNGLIFVNNSGQVLTFVNNFGQVLTFTAAVSTGFVLQHSSQFNATGRFVGATLIGTLNGIALQAVYVKYQLASEWGSG